MGLTDRITMSAMAGKGNQANQYETSEMAKSDQFNNPVAEKVLGTAVDGYRNIDSKTHRMVEERPESWAVLRLIKKPKGATGFTKVEQESNIIPPYTKFFLQQSSYIDQERYQIIESFGDFKIWFFGRRPIIKQFSGTLLNTQNHDWITDFEYIYENYLRGTQSVKLKAMSYLVFDNVILEGYIISAQYSRTAMEPNAVPFGFQMIITDKVPINLTGTKFRNQMLSETLPRETIEENLKKLPPTAINLMRQFFEKKETVAIRREASTGQGQLTA